MGFYKMTVDEQFVMWATLSVEEETERVKVGEKEKKFLWIFKYKAPVYEDQIKKNTQLNVYLTDGSYRNFGFGDQPDDIKEAEEIFERIKYKVRVVKV